VGNPVSPADSLRDHVRRVLTEAFERSRLDEDQVAVRAGVHPRTVHRVLQGETCGLDSVERVSRALGVRW
jgi:AraC-like DNA-binding protein